MDFFNNLAVIFVLIASSAFFSCAEIALASARKIRLQQLVEAGNQKAAKVIALQEEPVIFLQ